MMCALTGIPGTGKSSVADELGRRGYHVVRLVDTVGPYVTEEDPDRDTRVVDVDRWAGEFVPVDGIVEGHLAHFLPCEKTVILRCRPDVLRRRLEERGYKPEKVDENVEAEALDVILVEALEEQGPDGILEIDTTSRSPAECAGIVEAFLAGRIPPSYGTFDWSEYLEVTR